jgi:hypothetical protein
MSIDSILFLDMGCILMLLVVRLSIKINYKVAVLLDSFSHYNT